MPKKINPNSLENLRMGAIARNQDKKRMTFTLCPQSVEWLKASGNMSERIDLMISKILKGELIGRSELDRANEKIKMLEKK